MSQTQLSEASKENRKGWIARLLKNAWNQLTEFDSTPGVVATSTKCETSKKQVYKRSPADALARESCATRFVMFRQIEKGRIENSGNMIRIDDYWHIDMCNYVHMYLAENTENTCLDFHVNLRVRNRWPQNQKMIRVPLSPGWALQHSDAEGGAMPFDRVLDLTYFCCRLAVQAGKCWLRNIQ